MMASSPDGTPPTAQRMREIQQARERELVTKLESMLRLYVGDGDAQPPNKGQFVEWATQTAEALAEVNFGEAMLNAIGYVYAREVRWRKDDHYPLLMLPYLAPPARASAHPVPSPSDNSPHTA